MPIEIEGVTSLRKHLGRAPRGWLTNLRTGVTRKFQFNPTKLEEQLGAEYARQTVPGLSHQVLQFIHTRNRSLNLSLFYHNANYASETRGQNPILPTRAWFRSLVHPRRGGGRVTAGAPRILFSWPNFFSFTAVVTDVSFTYARFNKEGAPVTMEIEVTLEEIRDSMRLSEEAFDYHHE